MARYFHSRKRSAGRVISDFILNVAAIGGLLCIVLVTLAFILNMTLIMFKTGSMSPTIPAGSVALVQEIPASDMNVGDVITVDRAGKLPVTHRVTSIKPSGAGESRTFTMRGDANPVEDADPYTATEVRIVRGHLPNLASIIVWFSNPLVLGTITLAASGLVTWAFWPRPEDDDGTGGNDNQRSNVGKASHGTSNAALTVALLAAVAAVPFVSAVPTHAVETETRITGTVLSLTSIGDPVLMSNLVPGVPVNWQVGITADAPNPGTIDIGLSASGDSVQDQKLTVGIDSCVTRWTANNTCTKGQQTLVEPQSLSETLTPETLDGTRFLTSMSSAEQRWIRVTVTLDSTDRTGFSETLHIHAHGFGDEVSTEEGPSTLPETGFNLTGALLLALLALTTGVSVAGVSAYWKRKTL